MKTVLSWLLLSFNAWVLTGCADGRVSKRDDGRYVTLPANSITTGATNTPSDKPPPGQTGRQLSADHAYASTVVNERFPKEQQQRDNQEKLEADLAKLDSK